MATVGDGQGVNIPAEGGWFNAPHVDARRSALNTNDLRGKLLRIKVKDGDIAAAEANKPTSTARTRCRPGTCSRSWRRTQQDAARRSTRWASATRSGSQVDENDVAYITDYSPDSQTPQQFRGPAGTGRVEIVRAAGELRLAAVLLDRPAATTSGTSTRSTPLHDPRRQAHECDNPTPRARRTRSRWVANGGPTVEPGLRVRPPITRPGHLVLLPRQPDADQPAGHAVLRATTGPGRRPHPARPRARSCSPSCAPAASGPHGAAKYDYDPDNPNPTKFPPYYDGSVILGEFTRDTLREIRLDSQNRVFKINNVAELRRRVRRHAGRARSSATTRWTCSSGADGNFYLLTYGDGFFAINPDAGMYSGVRQGHARPVAVAQRRPPTDGPAPLTVKFSSAGSIDPDPGDSIRSSGTSTARHRRLGRPEPDAHLHDPRALHRRC